MTKKTGIREVTIPKIIKISVDFAIGQGTLRS